MKAVIFDLDGTLCNVSEALHHILSPPNGKKDWNAFHEAALAAPPHDWVVQMAKDFDAQGIDVLVVTARYARWERHSELWLVLNGVPYRKLFHRTNNDRRSPPEVKRDILSLIRLMGWDVIHAVEDNTNVINELWIPEGIPVTLVPGWFD
jgi:phosphoglycolate phosphatase-like HAD superfamily hydrolase